MGIWIVLIHIRYKEDAFAKYSKSQMNNHKCGKKRIAFVPI